MQLANAQESHFTTKGTEALRLLSVFSVPPWQFLSSRNLPVWMNPLATVLNIGQAITLNPSLSPSLQLPRETGKFSRAKYEERQAEE